MRNAKIKEMRILLPIPNLATNKLTATSTGVYVNICEIVTPQLV